MSYGYGKAYRRPAVAGPTGPTVPFASVAASGAFADYASTPPTFQPDVSPIYAPLVRQGYDATGTAVSNITESLVVTSRVRQVYPNQASLTALTVSLSDIVYSTDVTNGATNGSTVTSPPVVAAWGTVDRQLVGNSIPVEVLAFHRNYRASKPVACVVFTATDGTTTVSQTVTSLTVSGRTGDATSVVVYAATLDVTSLADNANITVNAKVYPWIGTAAAIADSSLNAAGTRAFCAQVYRKNTSRFANPPKVVISSTGNDGTAVVSTSQAAADNNPALTLNGAWAAARAQLGITAGSLDGLQIQGQAGTWELTASPTANTTNCDVVYTRHSSATRATCIFGFGTANLTQGATYMRALDCTVKRSGAFSFTMPTGGFSTFKDVIFDANTQSSTQYWTQNHRIDGGVTTTNLGTGGNLFSAGTHTLMQCRGLTYKSSGTTWQLEAFRVIGCDIAGISFAWGTRAADGSVIMCNKVMNLGSATAGDIVFIANAVNVSNFACIQNIFEWTNANAAQMIGLARDTGTGNVSNILYWHNTHLGFFNAGRANLFYDETTGTNRNHTLLSVVGNIFVQVNVKGDVVKLDGTKTGHFQALYGVGWSGNFTMYIDADSGGIGGRFAPAYPGLSSNWGTSSTVRNDPLFTNYQGTTNTGATPVAGAGNGDYHVSAVSPCKTLVPVSPLSHALDGVARVTTGGTAGAYQA